jgi:uncharacterized protein
MIIGVMSDTHDCLPRVERAVKRLNEERVDLVLHAGDFISPFVLPRLAELEAMIIGVFGNNDGEREYLHKKSEEYPNFQLRGNFAMVKGGGLHIALLHGHESELLHALIEREAFDIIVHGHTHKAAVYEKGRTLVVNPGEVGGYVTGKSTLALLDTDTRTAEVIDL